MKKTNRLLITTAMVLFLVALGCKQLNQTSDNTTSGGTTSLTDPLIIINSGAAQTSSTSVTLSLFSSGASEMYITNTAGCSSGGTWETFAPSKSWVVNFINSTGTVYVKFRNSVTESACVSDSISFLASGGWTMTSLNSAPTGRAFHSAIWTGERMLVWGGLIGTGNYNSGGAFDPISNSWTAITEGITGTQQHSAIWTGSEMIIWGGMTSGNGTSVVNSGQAYDPDTDTWTAITSTGAPTARRGHTAVWTGSRMIVWGGLDSSGVRLNSGGIYDPNTDTWSAITTTNAPSARYLSSAVWTGSRMIVWGGSTASSTSTNTGASYDPDTDNWEVVSTVGSAAARYGHFASWTGTRMLVWGGRTGSLDAVSSGSLYDPATDSWSAITDSPATIGTFQTGEHNFSVWTGTELITWGGYLSNATYSNRGAKYNLSTNSWAVLPRGDNLANRVAPSAVWTGASFIVWGGNAGALFDAFDDGAIYTP